MNALRLYEKLIIPADFARPIHRWRIDGQLLMQERPRRTTTVKPSIKPAAQIDSVHCAAICEEVGYRLRLFFDKEETELPAHLSLLLDKLRGMDREESPSIVPSCEDIKALDNAQAPSNRTLANASLSRTF